MNKESIDKLLSLGFTDATEQYASFGIDNKYEALEMLSDKLISIFGDGEVISFRGQKCAIKFRDEKLTVGLLFKSEYGSISYNGFTNLLGKRNEKVIRSCDSGKWKSRKSYEPDMDFIIPVVRWDRLSYPKTILKKDNIIVLSEDEAPFKFISITSSLSLPCEKVRAPYMLESIIMFCPVENKFGILYRYKVYQVSKNSQICPPYSFMYLSDSEVKDIINKKKHWFWFKVPVVKESCSFFKYENQIYFATKEQIMSIENEYYKKNFNFRLYISSHAESDLQYTQDYLDTIWTKQGQDLKNYPFLNLNTFSDLESEALNDYKVYEQKIQKEIKEISKRTDEWWASRLSSIDFDTFADKSLPTYDD